MTKAAGNALTIRMYNVGFGDCFLLVLPGTPPRTMLVDAGFHSQGKGAFSGNDLAERVIADVTELTGKARIDVIVATHRHQDHVYSFNSAAWNDIEIGEVWMPWVEDRKNAAARKLWKKKHAFAMQLSAALPALGLDATTRKEVEFLLWNAGVGGGEPGFAAWSNEGALDLLHDGFSSRDLDLPRFLPTGDTFPETFATKHLPGVKVHVLGPPRDPDLIAMGNPESDDESYHALALKTAEAAGKPIPKPFTSAWVARTQKGGAKPLSADEIARLRSLARAVDPLFAAAALDNMINATSLVLVLQIGKARLLLPGDAEWGTWKLILADDKARALLEGTTFLKVGHHGSHNATPKTLVETILKRGTKAMVSTQKGPGSYRHDIPLPELLKQLDRHGVNPVRSDVKSGALPKGFRRDPSGEYIELRLPF